jgi:hypothetical protein
MSWSLNITESTVGSELHDKIDALALDGASPEVQEQIDVAKDVARLLLSEGAVGSEEKFFVVGLHGHANPNHEFPSDGSIAADGVTVSVTQVTAPPVPEATEQPPAEAGQAESPDKPEELPTPPPAAEEGSDAAAA